jgi:hypothetical protein
MEACNPCEAPAGREHRIVFLQLVTVCLGAAQLTVAPDKTPDAAPAGRAGSLCARRTASRRLQVASSEFLFSRGKRRAACPLARGCVLRVNRWTVGRTGRARDRSVRNAKLQARRRIRAQRFCRATATEARACRRRFGSMLRAAHWRSPGTS